MKKYILLVLKVLLSSLCIYYVVTKIDVAALGLVLSRANVYYVILAIIFFVVSKVIASFRLNRFFQQIDVILSELENGKLYALGMFYNLFLPGGIGGDAYKVYYLQQHHNQSLKLPTAAVLLDRLSGVLALALLALALATVSNQSFFVGSTYLFLVAMPLIYVIYEWLLPKLFPSFKKWDVRAHALALLVQLSQVIAVWFLLLALGQKEQEVLYLLVFLISSLAAVLPISIGGIGIREFVFLQAAYFFTMDVSVSLSVSILFFLITAMVSLAGLPFSILGIDRTDKRI